MVVMEFRGSTLASPCRPTLSRRRCEPHGGSHIYPAWRRNFCRPSRQRLGTMKTLCVRPVEQRGKTRLPGVGETGSVDITSVSNEIAGIEHLYSTRTKYPGSLYFAAAIASMVSGTSSVPIRPERSEEHTSELQSLRHL